MIRQWRRLAAMAVTVVCCCAGGSMAAPEAPPPSVAVKPVPQEYAALSAVEKRLGVRVESLRLGAAGYMLDFRYYVWDSARSLPLVDRGVHPYVVHHESGAYLAIPAPSKVGTLRQRPRSHYPNRIYFMLFANPGGLVKAGDTVDIVLGTYRFENLVVQ